MPMVSGTVKNSAGQAPGNTNWEVVLCNKDTHAKRYGPNELKADGTYAPFPSVAAGTYELMVVPDGQGDYRAMTPEKVFTVAASPVVAHGITDEW